MQFFEFDTLRIELNKLPLLHQVAFAASICERLLPSYNVFCRLDLIGNSWENSLNSLPGKGYSDYLAQISKTLIQ